MKAARHVLLTVSLGLALSVQAASRKRPAATAPKGKSATRPAGKAKPTTKPAGPWDIVRDKEFTIAIPRGWRKADFLLSPKIRLYLNGDGIGAPMVDETRTPIQIGMMIERYANVKESPVEGAKRNLKNMVRDSRLKPIGKGKVTALKLADGTKGALQTVEFYKGRDRKSFLQKVFAIDKHSTAWVAMAWIVCGRDSKFVKNNPKLVKRLRAYITSMCFDGAKFSDKDLRATHGLPTTKPGKKGGKSAREAGREPAAASGTGKKRR